METILHILNGDATLEGFEDSGLDGDVMVWREVLSEGPLLENIASAEFWNRRSEWICNSFEETEDDYQAKMVDHLGILSEPFEEINLWFEFDLHCQVNLLGAMMLLKQHVDLSGPSFKLICPDSHPGVEDFRGMGQLDGDQLADLYDNRISLTTYDFELAEQAWKLYVAKDMQALQQFVTDTTFWGNMHLLKPALEAYLKRTTANAAGLNVIEQQLLDIYNSGTTKRSAIYAEFWKTNSIYGMGDMEIDIYLNRLREKGLLSNL